MSNDIRLFKKESVAKLLEVLKSSKAKFLAPVKKNGGVYISEVTSADSISFDHIQTNLSVKSVVFPQTEEILNYTFEENKDVTMNDRDLGAMPDVVVFGARPCEASGFGLLNSIFTWDTEDIFFKKRLEKTTVITIGCKKADDFCFCTSVNLSPGNTGGSDIFLTEFKDGEYLAEILTEKGKKLADMAKDAFGTAPAGVKKEEHLAKLPAKFDIAKLQAKLPGLFEKIELWKDQAMRCVGCGACAFSCPACVCFDLQDESDKKGGKRLRCWDSCGFSFFTMHTSGHNPRHIQAERWRQRVMHKFSYYKERFGGILCVGCGRCSRNCPADMNLSEHLKSLMEA